MKFFNICFVIVVICLIIVVVIGDIIFCICNLGLLKGNGGDCNQWCGDVCLKYLWEEFLIMDLVYCLDLIVCLYVLLIGDGIDILVNYL